MVYSEEVGVGLIRIKDERLKKEKGTKVLGSPLIKGGRGLFLKAKGERVKSEVWR